TLGHHLTVLNIQLQLAQAKAELRDTQAALQSIGEARHLGKLLIADVRETVSEMQEIDPSELFTLLQMTLNQTTSLQTSLVIEPTPKALTELSPELSHTLLQIVREVYTNTLKHARATLFKVTLTVDPQRLIMRISDDGKPSETPQSSGHGIHGIRERVAQLG